MLLEGRDLSCIVKESEVKGDRQLVLQVSPSTQEAEFSTKREERVINFGRLQFREEIRQIITPFDSPFTYRIASPVNGVRQSTIVILLAGLSGDWRDLVLLQATLLKAGLTVIYFDSRGTGENVMHSRTFGFLEAEDVVRVIEDIRIVPLLKNHRIGIFGSCLGACVALRACTLTNDIDAVVVEGAYPDTQRAIHKLNSELADEASSMRNKLGIQDADVAAKTFAEHFPPIPLRMVWGQFDQLVPSLDRKVLVEAYKVRSPVFENFDVPHGSHVIQFGFPLSDSEVVKHMTGICSFFIDNLPLRK